MKSFFSRARVWKAATEIVLAALVIFCCLFDWDRINRYEMVNTQTLHYEKAVVTRVVEESLTAAQEDASLLLGSQTLTVRVTSGDYAGQSMEAKNYLVRGHSIYAQTGDRLVVCVDDSPLAARSCTVYNYDRTGALLTILALFALILFAVGRRKGVFALGSLIFSAAAILAFAVQASYHGASPTAVSFATLLAISLFTFILICDSGRKLAVSVSATVLGVGLAMLLYALFSSMLHISGYNTDEVDAMVLIAQSTGLSIRTLLLVPVSVTALGAVMDVTLSLCSALEELRAQNSEITPGQLIRSGMSIGRDMIGTMSNTLILAILGENFLLALILISYGYQANQLLSSDVVAIQIAQSVSATAAVVASVPITAVIHAGISRYLAGRQPIRAKEKTHQKRTRAKA